MGDEMNKCEKHGQQIRSLEARVKDVETKMDNFAISLAENNTVTKHLDKTMTEFSGVVHTLGKTLTKVDINLGHLAEAQIKMHEQIDDLEKSTNKKFGELENKICEEEAKSQIDIRSIGKNILLYFVLPTTIIGVITTIILVATKVI